MKTKMWTRIALSMQAVLLTWCSMAQDCNPPPPSGSGGGGTTVPQSCDPNEVAGPLGFGDPATQRFVLPGQWLDYIVYFENLETATAAAQEVRVTSPLSPHLDWTSFEMKEVAFRNQVDMGLAGRANGQSEVPLNDTEYRVRTEVAVDPATGVVTWYLRIVDPATPDGWPLDAFAGFLPPNDTNPDDEGEPGDMPGAPYSGEGHVSYRIRVRDDAPVDQRIDASATIVFDTNDPIETDPAWFNHVAGGMPAEPTNPGTAAGAALPSASPLLEWDECADATSYRVWVWADGTDRPETPAATDLPTPSWQSTGLAPGTVYRWQVTAVNAYGSTSGPEWLFALGQAPARPLATAPADGATNVSLVPTLTASAFTDADADDTHLASQWQLALTADFGEVLWDSGSAAAQTTAPVPPGLLQSGTDYVWRVRYQDSRTEWSEWSIPAAFSTMSTYTLNYSAGQNGSLTGPHLQEVGHGADGSPVTAIPAEGFRFLRWSDDRTDNPRTDFRVLADLVVTALFETSGSMLAEGSFEARVGAAAVAAGRGLWDLTGAYSALANALALNLIHDTRGKLSGTATYAVAKDTTVEMPIKGSVKGTSGSIIMKGTLKGIDDSRTVSVSLRLNLTVDTATRQLFGRLTGKVKTNGTTSLVSEDLTLDMAGGMDGTWTLTFQLAQSGTAVTGTARLMLSDGTVHACVVRGKTAANNTAALTLTGHPAGPEARGIRIRTIITPLEGGWARIEALNGKAYGQALAW
jgi:hypothetical protein